MVTRIWGNGLCDIREFFKNPGNTWLNVRQQELYPGEKARINRQDFSPHLEQGVHT